MSFLVGCAVIPLLLCQCSSRDLYQKIGENKKVLVRQWTFPTRSVWEAGERGVEFSAPLLVDETLVFGSTQQGVIALYPGTNQLKWVLPIVDGVNSEILHHEGRLSRYVHIRGFFRLFQDS